MGWSQSTPSGLDRYFRALLEHLPEATGVVVGPVEDAPSSVAAAARHGQPLPRRLLAFWLAARRAGARADLLDAHFALYAAAPLLVGRLRARPAVFHFHGPWAQESLAAGDGSRTRYSLRAMLERRVLRRADAHVVLSGAFRRLLLERYRVAPWEVHVCPPGVELERFTPGERASARARLGLDPDAFVVLCARRLVARMGIDSLLDAWERLDGRLPEGSLLLLVGDGPLREHLRDRAARAPLAGRVQVAGRLPDTELIDAYRAADLAVVPSLGIEGFGLVVLEAAACGTPSVVTDVGGLPEAVAALDGSLVVAADDSRALAERIAAAAAGALPSRAATRRYAEGFDWHEVAERHRSLYRRLARRTADGRARIVYLDHVARLSGGEIALLRLLPHLHRVNAHVILGEDGAFASALQRAGVSVEVLELNAGARELRKDAVRVGASALAGVPGAAAHVARLTLRLRQLAPDLVHTNSLKAGVYGSLAARAAGVPMVWHVRDRVAEDYLPRQAIVLLRQMTQRLAGGVIAYADETLDALGVDGSRTLRWVIPDSVQVRERTGDPRPPGEETVFGMVGRIAPWKGQELFLRALAEAFPHGGARGVIVGTPMFGEERYHERLLELVEQLGLGPRVQFRGFREDVWAELARLDVLVHASITPEPFGQVVIEGMAAGLPVIAPDEGGPLTMISPGRDGLLFASRRHDELAGCMRSLHGDPARRRRLGEAAQRAVERYRPDAVATQLQAAYAELLGARGSTVLAERLRGGE